MKGIDNFFNKFNNIALKELHKREVICMEIEKITKQKIEIKDISIKNRTITVKGSQGFKSEIFLKKKVLLDIISKSIREKIHDII